MRHISRWVFVLLAFPLAAMAQGQPPASESAAPPTPQPVSPPPLPSAQQSWRLMLSDLTLLRVNPTGIETRARFGLQRLLYPSQQKLSANNFLFLGVYPKLNPVSAHLDAGLELQPVSVFNLRATAGVQQYFGALGYLQSFATPRANYSDARLEDLADTADSSSIFHASLSPQLQIQLGPIAIRTLLQLEYWDPQVRSGDTTAYEPTLDTLIPNEGWTISSDTDVLFVGRPRLSVGLRHTWVHPFYRREHFLDQADQDLYSDDNAHHRIGLFGAYTLKTAGSSRFNKPTVILIASWYLSHRYRTGEPDTLPVGGRSDDYISRALPYLALGFAFESDFLRVR